MTVRGGDGFPLMIATVIVAIVIATEIASLCCGMKKVYSGYRFSGGVREVQITYEYIKTVTVETFFFCYSFFLLFLSFFFVQIVQSGQPPMSVALNRADFPEVKPTADKYYYMLTAVLIVNCFQEM